VESDNGHIRYLGHLDENVKKALHLGGQLIARKAQEFAPIETGTMMRSVDVTPTQRIKGVLTVLVGPGPEAPYAPYTEEDRYLENKELGPKSQQKRTATEEDRYLENKELGPKSQQKRTARMPWLRPALEEEKDNVLDILSSAITGTKS